MNHSPSSRRFITAYPVEKANSMRIDRDAKIAVSAVSIVGSDLSSLAARRWSSGVF
jgi:hypothetical protein